MLYHLFLALLLAVSGGAKSHGVQFHLAEGLVVRFVPDSERQLIHPPMFMYPGGAFITTDHFKECLRMPGPGVPAVCGLFIGHTDGSPCEVDIVIADEDNMEIPDIIRILWVIKQCSQSPFTRVLVGLPNTVIYLRSGKLDSLRKALKAEQEPTRSTP